MYSRATTRLPLSRHLTLCPPVPSPGPFLSPACVRSYDLIESTSATMLSKRALKWFCRFLVGVTLVLGVLAASSAYWQSFDLSYVRAVGMYISFFIFGLGAPLVLRHFNLR